MRHASLVEIEKIEYQRSDLIGTVHNLESEREKLESTLQQLKENLAQVEQEIALLTPNVNNNYHTLTDILAERDYARQGLFFLEQKKNFFLKQEELHNLKTPSNTDNQKIIIPAYEVNEFCKVVSKVLKQWEFPGDCNVSFDYKTYDLRIDGKLRIDNGKGVRAIIHAAFKIALLLFCRNREIPHPGFVVLDTPLFNYQDPIKNPILGDLTEDEKTLANTSLKERFFEHLASIHHLGQFIILENIDPPENIENLAHVHLFSGNTEEGRYGLFPVSTMNEK
jgi:cell division protein FtsB